MKIAVFCGLGNVMTVADSSAFHKPCSMLFRISFSEYVCDSWFLEALNNSSFLLSAEHEMEIEKRHRVISTFSILMILRLQN
jgi:hypothetical protein